jgi:hypothetical protein
MKDTIYLPDDTTARAMMATRQAERILHNNPNLRFISHPRIVCKPIQERCVIEPSPIAHKSIREVV